MLAGCVVVRTSKCEYRKCESSCEEGTWDFDFEGEAYERNRYCCDYNYCNGEGTAGQGVFIVSRTGIPQGRVALGILILQRDT